MRHQIAGRRLSRTSSHRKALFRNMVTSLFEYERITTTVPKAKELRGVAEKLITIARKDSLSARRRVLRTVQKKSVFYKLFNDLALRFKDRPGGYTRIIRMGNRPGDNAEMAIIELVEMKIAEPEQKESTKKKPAVKAKKEPSKKKEAKETKAKTTAPKKTKAPAKKTASAPRKTKAKKTEETS